MQKREKHPNFLVQQIRSRGIDDVTQNAFGEHITCFDEILLDHYLKCFNEIKMLYDYINTAYPEDEDLEETDESKVSTYKSYEQF